MFDTKKVTHKDIAAARKKMSGNRVVVHLGGRSAASETELEALIRSLTESGRVESLEIDSIPAIPSLLPSLLAPAVIQGSWTEEQLSAYSEMLAELRDGDDIILPANVMEMYVTSTEYGEAGSENESKIRTVYYGPWRDVEHIAEAALEETADESNTETSNEDAAESSETTDTPDKPADNPVDEVKVDEVESDMPKNFPGRAQLIAAGHTSLEAVRVIPAEKLTEIPGIKAATAGRILAALEPKAE